MTIHKLVTVGDEALFYDSDDVETFEMSTPADVVERDGPNGTLARELGQQHVHLALHFKPGKSARWEPVTGVPGPDELRASSRWRPTDPKIEPIS